ncbi:MAG: NUDIX domain-containing protein [bacterium]|jgi:nucleoside triphosphatase
MEILVTVGALIINKSKLLRNKFLLINTHKWNGLWGIPGGKVNYKEKLIDALKREILEETGLNIYNIKFITFFEAIEDKEFYKKNHMILFNYLAFTKDINLKLNDEIQDYMWLSYKEYLLNLKNKKIILNTYTKKLISIVAKKYIIKFLNK